MKFTVRFGEKGTRREDLEKEEEKERERERQVGRSIGDRMCFRTCGSTRRFNLTGYEIYPLLAIKERGHGTV